MMQSLNGWEVWRNDQQYTRADLNWNDQNSRSSVEMKNPASRPAIAAEVQDMEQYETIFVGFPKMQYGI